MESPFALVLFATGLIFHKLLLANAAPLHLAKAVTNFNEGGKMALVCLVDREAEGTLEWRHNQTVMNLKDPRYHEVALIAGDQSQHTLTITDVQPDDAGTYDCRFIFADSINIEIVVMTALQIVETTPPIKAGGDLLVVCEGVLSSNIVWYHNGRRLANGEDISITTSTDVDNNRQRSWLKRIDVDEHQSGYYSCVDMSNKLDTSKSVSIRIPSRALGHVVACCRGVISLLALFLMIFLTDNRQ